MTRRSVLVLAAALAAALGAPPSAAAQPAPLDGFDGLVAGAVRDWQVPGLAVAVVKDGAVIFSQGYGVRQLGSRRPSTSTRCLPLVRPRRRRPRRWSACSWTRRSSPGTIR